MVKFKNRRLRKKKNVVFRKIEEKVDTLDNEIERVIILDNEEERGYIDYEVFQHHMLIKFLYVVEAYRDKDYAQQLMWYVLSTKGLKEVRLYPQPSPLKLSEKFYLNKEALQKFYSFFGFGFLGIKKIIPRT